jgi:DNA modification methylase
MTVEIIVGDCRDVLKTMPDQSVHCVVTSPPYFGLRDYGVDGQMGLEPSPDEFVSELVGVFREVRRVLRDDGTVWLNIGDSYAGSGRGGNPTRESSTLEGSNASQEASMIRRTRAKGEIGGTARDAAVTQRGSRLPAGLHEQQRRAGAIGRAWVPPPSGLKQKDLIGIPWMVAFALRADGWYLRQDIIWSKPNPMPESVQDRCTKAHEYLFLLSKSARYYFDHHAIAEERTQTEDASTFRGGSYVGGATDNATLGKRRVPGNKAHKAATAYNEGDERHRTKAGLVAYSARERDADPSDIGTRNKRSVWTIATHPFKEAHFATFPPALIEPCILAGCPVGGMVLDPFGGAGTTGLVADRLQRHATLIELNPAYADIARRRIHADAPLLGAIA